MARAVLALAVFVAAATAVDCIVGVGIHLVGIAETVQLLPADTAPLVPRLNLRCQTSTEL